MVARHLFHSVAQASRVECAGHQRHPDMSCGTALPAHHQHRALVSRFELERVGQGSGLDANDGGRHQVVR